MSGLLSTTEMMEVTKLTGKIAVIVELPALLEPYKNNWLGGSMFYDKKYDRYCVNTWKRHYGYPFFSPSELADSGAYRDIKWKIDENLTKAKPMNPDECCIAKYYQDEHEE